MLNKILKKTLMASIREFWNINKNYILLLPVIQLVILLFNLLQPSGLLYNSLFNDTEANNLNFIHENIEHGFGASRFIALAAVATIVVLCTHRYLGCIKKQSRFITIPITDNYRIATLWIFSVGIMVAGCIILALMDHAVVGIMKHYFLEKVTLANDNYGNLYPVYDTNSYFETLSTEKYIAIIFVTLFFLPVLHLAYFLFKKYSLLYSGILYACILGLVIISSIKIAIYRLPAETIVTPFSRYAKLILVAITLSLLIVSFKQALKEREV